MKEGAARPASPSAGGTQLTCLTAGSERALSLKALASLPWKKTGQGLWVATPKDTKSTRPPPPRQLRVGAPSVLKDS